MRKAAMLAILAAVMSVGLGCHKAVASAPVPGAVNTFDSTTYRALMDAQAAINSLKGDIAAGKLAETPAMKTALNQAITDYNTADALWQTYHSSASTAQEPALQAAINKLQTDTTTLGGIR